MDKKYIAQGRLGYKEVNTWEEASYVMLTKHDFNELIRDNRNKDEAIKTLKTDKKNLAEKMNHYKDRKEYYKKERNNIQTTKDEEIKDILAEHEIEISELNKAVDRALSLNNNLIRVATERANKDRNLSKEHNGYVMLSWEKYTYNYNTGKRGKDRFIKYNFYKAIYQTPWDCSFPLETLYEKTRNDLQDCTLEIIKGDLDFNYGCYNPVYSWGHNSTDLAQAIDGYKEDDDGKPHIMSVTAKANVTKGLWEVTFITDFEPEVLEKHRKKYV